jgi:hypothetical protein
MQAKKTVLILEKKAVFKKHHRFSTNKPAPLPPLLRLRFIRGRRYCESGAYFKTRIFIYTHFEL